MRKIRFWMFTILFAMVVFFFVPNKSEAATYLSNKKLELEKGKSYRLYLYGTTKKCKWSSSNKKVATVNGKGKVKAKKAGKATIKASYKVKGRNKTRKCKVTVRQPKVYDKGYGNYAEYRYFFGLDDDYGNGNDAGKVVDTSQYKMSETEKTVDHESSFSLYIQNKKSKNTIIWSSDNPAVAEVSSNGYVDVKSKGKAVITASVDGWSGSCVVNVYTRLVIQKTDYKLAYRETEKIQMNIAPSEVKITCRDEKIATVDKSGVILAKELGVTKIDIEYYGKINTLNVYVGLKRSDYSHNTELMLHTGEVGNFDIDIKNKAVERDIEKFPAVIYSSDTEVCDVDADGNIYAKNPGTAYVTVLVLDTLDLNCEVKVYDFQLPDGVTSMGVGEYEWKANKTISPSYYTVTSDSDIVKIEEGYDGYAIEAVAPGKAVITYDCNGYKRTREIHVKTGIVDAIKNRNYLGYSEKEARVLQTIRNVIDSNTSSNMTTSQKVKAIHDYIVLNCQYDTYEEIEYRMTHSFVSVFMNRKAVCSAYAQSFMICMQVLDIPCRMVIGDTINGYHSWNQVYVDGTWYYIDLTWDDTIRNTEISYMYYLTTSLWSSHYFVESVSDTYDFESYMYDYY